MTEKNILADETVFKSFDGASIRIYIARPSDSGTYPGLLIVQEIWGLENNIKDIARRFAKQGFVAVAPHLYSRPGQNEILTPENIESAMTKMWALPLDKRRDMKAVESLTSTLGEKERKVLDLIFKGREKLEENMIKDLLELYKFVQTLPYVNSAKIGGTGFCMGGGLIFQLSTMTDLSATVVFYGSNPKPIEDVSKIKGKVLGLYAGEDLNINAGLPALIEQFVKSKKEFELKIYEGALHAFFNDTRPTYNKAVATDAWNRALEFFNRNLKQ
jgi:carboxymethylenebutenolidase